MARWSLFVVAFLALLAPCSFGEQQGGELAPPSASRSDRTTGGTQVLSIGGATIEVEIAAGSLDVHPSQILSWIERAARAVTTYYGRFPVQRVRVRVVTDSGQDDSIHGTTWGNVGGFQGVTRMRLGRHVTEQDLADDWTMTHRIRSHGLFVSAGQSELDGGRPGDVCRADCARSSRATARPAGVGGHGPGYVARAA